VPRTEAIALGVSVRNTVPLRFTFTQALPANTLRFCPSSTWIRLAGLILSACSGGKNGGGNFPPQPSPPQTSQTSLLGWGRNTFGELGNGHPVPYARPIQPGNMPPLQSASGGRAHTVALDANGEVWTWGDNLRGQLGISGIDTSPVPVKVPKLSFIIAVSAGADHSVALRDDGRVFAWGWNAYGQLGDGMAVETDPGRINTAPVRMLAGGRVLSGAISISAGAHHTAVLRWDGSVWSCGLNSQGQLGDGTTQNRARCVPVLTGLDPITPLTGVKSISAGGSSTYAVLKDSVLSWGSNVSGELGCGSRTPAMTTMPVTVVAGVNDWTPLRNVAAVSAGSNHAVALLQDGTLRAWGSNRRGELGSGIASLRFSVYPLLVLAGPGSQLQGVHAVEAGANWTMVLLSDGSVRTFGSNSSGQLANGELGFSPSGAPLSAGYPMPVRDVNGFELSAVRRIAGGAGHGLALRADGAWSWGNDSHGQLADGYASLEFLPTPVIAPTTIVSVAAGGDHVTFLDSSGSVWTMGHNQYGQLGVPSLRQTSVAVKVPGIESVEQVAAGISFTLALRTDGTVWAWGINSSGELGSGTGSHEPQPVQVESLEGIRKIAAAGNHSAALSYEGTVWTWGDNSRGQLGDGTTTNAFTPVRVLDGVVDIAAGKWHVLARTVDELKAWGWNQSGQLGCGSDNPIFTAPVTVGDPSQPLKNIARIAAGGTHSLALHSDGTVSAWGSNAAGQIAAPQESRVPRLIFGLQGVVEIGAGTDHSLARLADGKVVHWGRYHRRIRRSPETVVEIDDAVRIFAGGLHSFSIVKSERE